MIWTRYRPWPSPRSAGNLCGTCIRSNVYPSGERASKPRRRRKGMAYSQLLMTHSLSHSRVGSLVHVIMTRLGRVLIKLGKWVIFWIIEMHVLNLTKVKTKIDQDLNCLLATSVVCTPSVVHRLGHPQLAWRCLKVVKKETNQHQWSDHGWPVTTSKT